MLMFDTTTCAIPPTGQTETEMGRLTIPQAPCEPAMTAFSGAVESESRVGIWDTEALPRVSAPESTLTVPPMAVKLSPTPSSTLAATTAATLGTRKVSVRLGARHERPGSAV